MAEKGRPTDYKPEYCEKIIEYFDKDPIKEVKLKDKNGKETIEEIPADFPTFEGFAVSIKVHRETLLNWKKKHKEFFDAYTVCQDIQKNILIQNGLRGNYNCLFAKFVAINATDMRDKQELQHSGKIETSDIKEVIKDLKESLKDDELARDKRKVSKIYK